MACSPIASLVAAKVIDMIQRPSLTANVKNLEALLRREFEALCEEFPGVFAHGTVLGAMATIGLRTRATRDAVQPALFKRGVMCHSISLIELMVIKFFPCLTSDASVVTELAAALRDFASDLMRGPAV